MKRQNSYSKPKEVVSLLAKFIKEEERNILDKQGNKLTKTYLLYECPNQNCKELNRQIAFQKNSGYVNPYQHLRTCLANEDTQYLQEIVDENKKRKQQGSYNSFFKPTVSRITPKENALYDYIRLIVFKNQPLAIVEDREFRSFSKNTEYFSKKTVKEVMFKLVELVGKAIALELKESGRGAILHDGWTCGGVHYIALFASYNRVITSDSAKNASIEKEVELSLLSCAPMANIEVAEHIEDDSKSKASHRRMQDVEAVNFSADTHAEHIKAMFQFYDVNVCDWAVCQVADNCRVNQKVSRLLSVPHVGCKSHLLNLEVNHMVDNTADLSSTLESVHESVSQCKKRLRNAALLRNLVDLRPVTHNKTRWSGKFFLLQRFLRIREELIQVSDDDQSDFFVNRSSGFRNKVQRYCGQLEHINHTTVYLQTTKLSLLKCQGALDLLIDDVHDGFANPSSKLYRCFLKAKYISNDAYILKDRLFESGVVKIQNGESHRLSVEERSACQKLLSNSNQNSQNDEDSNLHVTSVKERLERRKRRRMNMSNYMDCDFILGSAAEVERLWSVADNILRNQRMRLTPLLFESIIFLRTNWRLWDVHLVKEAFHLSRSDRVTAELDAESNQEQLFHST